MKKTIVSAIAAAMLLNTSALGYTFPNGSVQGLPQNLIVMDENGHSPENGELYIYIEDMIPYEVYKKDITVMNARDDAVYSVFMTAAPNYNEGDIDLLGETECTLYLDDKLIYEGLVNGDGSPNMQTTPLDLGGVYKSGESRNLHAEFVWKAGFNEEDDTDNAYHGEVSFHWTFFASITEPDPNDPNDPNDSQKPTGGNTSGGGSSYYPSGNTDTDLYNEVVRPPTNNYKDKKNEDTPSPTEEQPSVFEPTAGQTTEGIVEKVINKLPIPADVKTGYKSQLVFYTKIAITAFALVFVLLMLIIFYSLRLKKLKNGRAKSL